MDQATDSPPSSNPTTPEEVVPLSLQPPQFARRITRLGNTPPRPPPQEVRQGQFAKRSVLTEIMTRRETNNEDKSSLHFGRRHVISQTASNKEPIKEVEVGQFARRHVLGEPRSNNPQAPSNNNNTGENVSYRLGRHGLNPRKEAPPEIKPAQFGRRTNFLQDNAEKVVVDDVKPAQFGKRAPRQSGGSGITFG
ncbi:uncharacterized protein LOC110863310 [Folsomia candida]|uniref:Uncharacterized protein n=1 Tax=Folsomia candida TaxID=158441 RepID=A0A226EW90_FOLCA|nr:uncharacterized protein LOC110863310 [Folsomia candida]OXA61344.1 hypothetical protein Fcan01_01381 [Folsomia candida]